MIDSIRKDDLDKTLELLSAGVDVFPPRPLAAIGMQPAAIEAALAGRHDILEAMLERSPGALQSLDQSREASVLHCVCFSKEVASVCLLMNQSNMDVDLLDVDGMTPLHYAACVGNIECCRILVNAGIDVYKKSTAGITATMAASGGGHLSCVKYLAKLEDVLKQQDAKGRTALMYAAANKRGNVVKILLQCSADPAVRDFDSNRNSLHWACYSGSLVGTVAILHLGRGLINVKDKFGCVPFICVLHLPSSSESQSNKL